MSAATLPHDWLVPDWPAPAGVRALFTTRSGGYSAVPYDSLNLGDHVGNDADMVRRNRAAVQAATGARPVFMQQVHGHGVLALAADTPPGQTADACLSTHAGLACTVMVADCLPVLLCSARGDVVAAAHAGWRGLAGEDGTGVLESVFAALVGAADSGGQDAIAWLGPCIGPTAFEVGAEVKAAFEAVQPQAGRLFHEVAGSGGRKFLADLPGLARLRLNALGLTRVYGNDGSAPWCTVLNPSRFFSHRRDAGRGDGANGFGTTGRMAACIWRDAGG